MNKKRLYAILKIFIYKSESNVMVITHTYFRAKNFFFLILTFPTHNTQNFNLQNKNCVLETKYEKEHIYIILSNICHIFKAL